MTRGSGLSSGNPPIRWRLQWWIAGEPEKSRKQWYSSKCKLCACKKAADLAKVMCDLAKVGREHARWSVARVKGHLTEPEVVATSGSVSRELVTRHAH